MVIKHYMIRDNVKTALSFWMEKQERRKEMKEIFEILRILKYTLIFIQVHLARNDRCR